MSAPLTHQPPAADPLSAAAMIFTEHGTRQDAGSAAPFVLAGTDAWLVVDGAVDVFAVSLVGNEPAGARSHLLRVDAGHPLFGLGSGLAERCRGLLAVGTSGTRLLRISQEVLRSHARTVDGARPMAALLDDWVEALCSGITRGGVPARCVELGSGEELAVPAGTTARSQRSVSWVRHVSGHSHLLGRDELTVNGVGLTPVSRRAWLEVREPGRVLLLDAADVGDPDELWGGLARLHDLVLRYTEIMVRQTAAGERDRLRRRANADRAALRAACDRLASTMDPRAGHTPQLRLREDCARPPAWDDALFAACRLVGETLDIVVKPYPRVEGAAPPRDALGAIARASRLRVRQVALRDNWWQRDNGPLLATILPEQAEARGSQPQGGTPVALLRDPRNGGYVLHDAVAREERPVTAAIAARLAPFGQTFYRPFPDAALGVMDVLRFGLRGCRRDLMMVIAMGVAAALLGLIPSIATGMLFNTVIPGALRSQLVQMMAVLLVCAIATSLFTITRGVALLRVEGRMSAAVQAAVWDRLLSLPMPFFRPYPAGDLAVRAMGIDAIRQVVSGSTVSAILGGIFSLFNFGLMFWYSPAMAWRASALIAAAVSVTVLGSWLQLKHQRGVSVMQARVSGLVLQLLTGIAKLRIAGAETQAFTQWATRFGAQRQLQFRVRRIGISVTAFHGAFPLLANIVIFAVALPLLGAGGTLRTGDFLAFLSAYASCQGALLATCGALLQTLATVPMYEQAKPILTALPEVDQGKSDPGVLAGDIEIQHAAFRYDADGAIVLRDVTIRVRPGEFIALVGPSGSGKSTILRLLLGFEQLESGAIYYDGQELGGLDIQAVRRQIGVVLQNGQLMSGDIYTNITGSAQLSMDDAWEAARMAGFDADIRAMPMGMHTVISEGGGTLSGGQRQRLMIARAIVHRPRLLFFDEATSALDNRTQAIVSASLERLNATRIVVAHRLSTIVNADRIIVIQRGQIVEQGRYDELMARNQLFAELARRQLA